MDLPPAWRRLQQTWTYHIAVSAIGGGGVVASTCIKLAHAFSRDCLFEGIAATGIAFFLSVQHSPNSASFNRDGTDNEMVKKVASQGNP
jgi:hypothetical protein